MKRLFPFSHRPFLTALVSTPLLLLSGLARATSSESTIDVNDINPTMAMTQAEQFPALPTVATSIAAMFSDDSPLPSDDAGISSDGGSDVANPNSGGGGSSSSCSLGSNGMGSNGFGLIAVAVGLVAARKRRRGAR